MDIYANEAVSGTKADKRKDFKRLLADCRRGKIDRVKSISRFSRNTKDCLADLRELMRLGVTVQFEKENMLIDFRQPCTRCGCRLFQMETNFLKYYNNPKW